MRRYSHAELKRELALRESLIRRAWDPYALLQPQQIPCFIDPKRDRVITGTRQLGKTFFGLAEAIDASILIPNSESAYVDMDKEHGGKVAWDALRIILSEFIVPASIVDDELRFENGSKVYIFSGEPSQLKKLQGLKYARLIVDESQELRTISKLLTLCKPALLKHNGRVILMGIPGRVSGFGDWWDICEGKLASEFGQHRGTFWDNPHLSEEAKHDLFESEKRRLGEHHPDFLRHWCGKWPAVNMATRVYHYDPEVNSYTGDAPPCALHALGLDPGGVRDEEAAVVLGYGNEDDVSYIVDEEGQHAEYNDDDELDEVDWDDSANIVGPLNEKWTCTKRFYDYGSAHKDALTLVWRSIHHIIMSAVPSKDPYNESKRINTLFAQRKLFVKSGSKLEQDLLYTEWDVESLKNGGKPKYSRSWKQNFADALRCVMWAYFGVTKRTRKKVPQNDVEQEAERIATGAAYKKVANQTRQDKYSVPGVARAAGLTSAIGRNAPRPSVNGRINRGY